MKIARVLASAMAATSVAACLSNPVPNNGYPRVEAVTPGIVTHSSSPLREYQVDVVAVLEQTLCQGASCPDGNGYERYARLLALADQRRDVEARNTVVAQLVAASVHNCHIYMESLRGGQVGVRTASDMMATTFGLAGGLVEPLSTARSLSALGAWSTASGAAWDRNVYADQAAEMIAEEIRKLRLSERAALEAKYARGYDAWPLSTALTDVADFHHSCSMLRGISLIQDAVANRERSVRAARHAAMAALTAGGDGVAVAAAVAGVESIFLGYGNDSLAASNDQPFVLGGDLNRLIANARRCADEMIGGETTSCTGSEGWDGQFIALANTERGKVAGEWNDAAKADFDRNFWRAVQARRRAIEAGRALYVETLRRSAALNWGTAQVSAALRALSDQAEGAEAPRPDLAAGQNLTLEDPVLDLLSASYATLANAAGEDRELVLRSTLALAQSLMRGAPSGVRAEVQRQVEANERGTGGAAPGDGEDGATTPEPAEPEEPSAGET